MSMSAATEQIMLDEMMRVRKRGKHSPHESNYALENMLLKIDNDTRWYELFGTPERAAKTISDACGESEYCGGCPAVEMYCHNGNYDALLEWLRDDA